MERRPIARWGVMRGGAHLHTNTLRSAPCRLPTGGRGWCACCGGPVDSRIEALLNRARLDAGDGHVATVSPFGRPLRALEEGLVLMDVHVIRESCRALGAAADVDAFLDDLRDLEDAGLPSGLRMAVVERIFRTFPTLVFPHARLLP